jgi:hypothetical protein
MNEATEVTPNLWLDEDSNTVVILIDRVSIAMDIFEFWDLCEEFENAKAFLSNHQSFVIGEYEEGGETKQQLLLKPKDDELN